MLHRRSEGPGRHRATSEVLRRRGVAERVCIAGAWDGWLGQVRREVPEVRTALGWRSLTVLLSCARSGLRPPRALATAPFAHVPVKLGRFPIFVERLAAMSHDIGVRVVTWTVDDPVVIRRLLDVGVDAIITDRPDVLREVLVSRNQWAPMLTRDEAHRPLNSVSLPKHAEDGDRSGVAAP